MKPSFKDTFWIIYQEMFKPKTKTFDWMQEDIKKDIDYITYQKIIPVYVMSVNDMYDGSTQFNITPVDIRDGITKHWKWSRSVEDKDIGDSVFETKEEAEKIFETRYSKEQIRKFEEKDRFRELYE